MDNTNKDYIISCLKSENKALNQINDSLKKFILEDGEKIKNLENEINNLKTSKKCLLCECSKKIN